ncbi:MAG: FAD-binding protein, partial [Phaeodactylibacter sp.]|nr:FAD-binding protein [Phaeodactylibacter sp.]
MKPGPAGNQEQEMIKQVELKLLPAEAADESLVRLRAIRKSRLPEKDIKEVVVTRRSIDARGPRPLVILRADIYAGETYSPEPALLVNLKNVEKAPAVAIVGAGPAGYFAALELIELGLKPVLFDRGKDVRTRRRDLRAIQKYG